MSELSRSSKYRATPGLPLPDAERERLVERLNTAYESGKVGPDAYQGLLDTVFSATTLGQVAPVVEALPGEVTYDVPAVIHSGTQRPGELAAARPASPILGVAIAGGVVLAILVLLGVLGVILF